MSHVIARAAVLASLALLLAVPSASALVVTAPDGTTAERPYQAWADREKIPTPPGSFAVADSDCPFAGYPSGISCSYLFERTIYLSQVGRNRWTFAHELGHEFDFWRGTPRMRDRFQQIMGYTPEPWAGRPGAPVWEASPRERFAEGYSACAMRWTIKARWDGNYGYTPTPSQHVRVCRLIRRTVATPGSASTSGYGRAGSRRERYGRSRRR